MGPALAALGVALAACGTTSQYAPREGYTPPQAREPARPNFPITQPPADQPVVEAPPVNENGPTARPSGEVTSQPLPPPGPAQQQDLPPPPPPPNQSSYTAPPPAYTAPRMVTTTTTETSIAGRVVDISGKPEVYVIKSGDTLTAIAKRMGVTQKSLADGNDLEAPYVLRPGRTLKGPATRAKAYEVESGDTLYGIARRFNVSAAAIAEENDRKVGDGIRAGERLTLPKGFKDSGPTKRTVTTTVAAPTQIAQAPAYQPPVYRPPATPAPSTTVTTAPAAPNRPASTSQNTATQTTASQPVTSTTTTTTAPPRPGAPPITTTTTTIRPATPAPAASLPVDGAALSDSEIAAAGRGRFTWPVRGAIISSFGPMGTGQRNDGLNVRANAGDVVRAAAAGEVVYAGDLVPGFGNLVLVKHDAGWVTAYAHLQRSDVKMRQTVAQGQQIGLVGSSGGVPEPQLHFEVRYAPSAKDKARPIDPALVLPR